MGRYIEILAVCLAGIMSLLLTVIFRRAQPGKHLVNIRNEITGHDYGSLTGRLVKSGVADKVSPPLYRLLQSILFLVVFLLLFAKGFGPVVSTGAGILIMLLPELLLKANISLENKKMLPDIEHLYNLLHLQAQAGAFFTDNLVDCYRVVTYWRLKKALIDLTGAINSKKPVREAAEEFAGKFDNPYITTLADIICHSVEDGNTDAMLGDVTERIRALQEARYKEEEGRQEAESLLFMTLLFIGIVAGVLYVGAGALTNSAGSVL